MYFGGYLLFFALLTNTPDILAKKPENNSLSLMQKSQALHQQFPYIYEEQTMILQDRQGHRNVRRLRRYSRVEADQSMHYLLVFDHPPEIKGVALMATRTKNGIVSHQIYLPAFGQHFINSQNLTASSHFLGTDFAISDLTPEVTDDFIYRQSSDIKINHITHKVVQVFQNIAPYKLLRTHYIRQDNIFITRTDYFNENQQLTKRRTHHDLKQLDENMWRANMLLMVNYKNNHRSLLKINRRILSYDYVPNKVFTLDWLIQNARTQPLRNASNTAMKEEPLLDNAQE